MRSSLLALVLVLTLLVNAFGQQPHSTPVQPPTQPRPAPAQPPATDDEDEVVRITTNLVQLDAVVTDREGRQVTDLKAGDFEIMENGRPQPITNFSYVSSAPAAPGPGEASAPARGGVKAPDVPSARLRPEQVRRAIALVVDDLRMSAEGIAVARQALRKYVDEQMQPGDLVAIIRTSAGIGALQQFTSDRQQLLAAVERVHPLMRSTRLGAFTSVNVLDRLETQKPDPAAPAPGGDPSDKLRSESVNEFRDTLFTVGTLGALNFVVRGLRELPGRKAVMLFSDGISIFNQNSDTEDRSERVVAALRYLVDQANRASVVIYTIDTRGLQPTGLTAADSTSGGPFAPDGAGPGGAINGLGGIPMDQVGQKVLGVRSAELFEGQNGLHYLANQTGGAAFINQNDLNKGIRRALDDIRGYYLIGYRPDESSFDPVSGRRKFNTWAIKVKGHPDLRVRARSGYYGVADDRTGKRPQTRAEQMMRALLSPFSASGVGMQLTSFFMNEAAGGSAVRSVLLMDARNLTFTPLPDGRQQTVIDVVAVTLGEDGQVVDQVTVTETVRVKAEVVERFMREGMIYGMNVPVARPGAYQLRVAVRDSASGRIGSASQYIEVPNVNKDRLVLSSLVIVGNKPTSTANDLINSVLGVPVPASPASSRFVAGGEGMSGSEVAQAGPGSRVFRYGMYLDYACVVFNAKNDKSKHPQLTTQVRLFHENREVFTGEVLPVETSGQSDLKRLIVARRLQLGTILEPGDYVLHLTVNDVASGGQRTVTGWIDFKLTN